MKHLSPVHILEYYRRNGSSFSCKADIKQGDVTDCAVLYQHLTNDKMSRYMSKQWVRSTQGTLWPKDPEDVHVYHFIIYIILDGKSIFG